MLAFCSVADKVPSLVTDRFDPTIIDPKLLVVAAILGPAGPVAPVAPVSPCGP